MTPDDMSLEPHQHRFPRWLYREAARIAARRGETVSSVLRDALSRYVRRHGGDGDER